jgi:16S rRNA pseudouridine516 synthase
MAEPRTPRGARVDQLLSRCGYCSRRESFLWVRAGRVTCNDVPVEDPGERVDPAAVRIDGKPVEAPDGLLAMLHKPLGVVCAHGDRDGPSVYGLLPERWSRRNPVVTSIGRLDKDTSGLLLLTDLGELVHRFTSPRHHVEKTYEVVVDEPLRPELVERFAAGTLVLEGEDRPCLPARLEIRSEREARLILTEGKFHQVRRMFAAVGSTVIRLHRSRVGAYELGDLPAGEWRLLPLP